MMRTSLLDVIAITLTILFTPLVSFSQPAAFDPEAFRALSELSNANNDFKEFLEGRPSITTDELSAQVVLLESKAERYFELARIRFDKFETSLSSVTLPNGQQIPSIRYHQYELRGSRGGDRQSRLLLSITELTETVNNAKVVFDPLYFISFPHFSAHYSPYEHKLVIQTENLIFRELGIGDSIRHEIQHHFERLKMERGEMTLARFYLSNPNAANEPHTSYAQQMSLDEVETLLRDLRYAVNIAPRNLAAFLRLLEPVEAERYRVIIEQSRVQQIEGTLVRLREMVRNSTETLNSFRSELLKIGSNHFQFISGHESLRYGYELKNTPYSEVNFTIATPKADMTQQELFDSILAVTDFSLARLAAVAREVDYLQNRRN